MRRLPDRLLVSVVLSGTICALVALLANWVPYADLDNWTYDFLVNHGRYAQPSSDVVFVDFDDQTFEQVKQYPMPRSIIAQVIQQIGRGPAGGDRAGCSALGAARRGGGPGDAGCADAGGQCDPRGADFGWADTRGPADGAVLPAGRQLVAIRVLHRRPAGRDGLCLDQYAFRRRWLCSRYAFGGLRREDQEDAGPHFLSSWPSNISQPSSPIARTAR